MDPLELYSRRLIHFGWEFLTKGLAPEQKTEIFEEFDGIGKKLLKKTPPPKKVIKVKKDGTKAVKHEVAPPPGWKTDEQNYAAIQGMLGMLGTVKGAVSQQKEVKQDGR